MVEIILCLVFIFLYFSGCYNLVHQPDNSSSIYLWIFRRIVGFIEIIATLLIAYFSVIGWLYKITWIVSIFGLLAYFEEIIQPFVDFNCIYKNMSVLPEQKLNYDIFKQIFVIDPKSFVLANHNLFYVDENQKCRKFYMGRVDLYRALKLIDEYQTKGINNNATPITDDMMKKIKKEHEKGEKLQAEAIEGLTKASENWKI